MMEGRFHGFLMRVAFSVQIIDAEAGNAVQASCNHEASDMRIQELILHPFFVAPTLGYPVFPQVEVSKHDIFIASAVQVALRAFLPISFDLVSILNIETDQSRLASILKI